MDQYSNQELFWDGTRANIRSDLVLNPTLIPLIWKQKGKRVLDLGCGVGHLTEQVAGHAKRVTGVDRSASLIAIAQAREGRKVDYRVADVRNLPFKDASFDVAYSAMTFLHLSAAGLSRAYREAHRVLSAGGMLIVASVHPVSRITTRKPALVRYISSRAFDYFRSQKVDAVLLDTEGSRSKLDYYHHPLSTMVNAATTNGFILERIIEPKPNKSILRAFGHWLHAEQTQPSYIVYMFLKTGM